MRLVQTDSIQPDVEHKAVAARPIVMVVDDDALIADTTAEILNHNVTCMAFYSGESALAALRTYIPDILLTDVAMPGMNGIELAVAVNDIAPQCKILLFSGHTETADRLAQANALGYKFTILAKPIHPSALLAEITALLQ